MAGKEVTSSLFVDTSDDFSRRKAEEPCGSHVIRVAVESSGADAEFDYLVPDEFWPIEVGRRVEVPFGKSNKLEMGFCVESDVPAERAFGGKGEGGGLKSVRRVVDEEPLLGPQLMELAGWISDYYVCPLGQVLSAMVPGAVKRGAGVKRRRYVYLAMSDEVLDAVKGPKKKEAGGGTAEASGGLRRSRRSGWRNC